MSIIISDQKLKELINDKKDLAIIDVRTKTKDFTSGEAAYGHCHLPKALFLDVKKDLSGENTFLPDVEQLSMRLGHLGIQNNTDIVLYDQGNHRSASKAWFVLRYLGHETVHILNGGFQAWINEGNSVTSERPNIISTTYYPKPRTDLLVDIEQVKDRLEEGQSTLIDSRAPDRYTGKIEPKYRKAGHIPGAKNYHAKLVFEENGLWKSNVNLAKHFSKLTSTDEVMVSCGSGNSACMNLVALKEAGFQNVKLFPGGYSEWIEEDRKSVV